MRKEIVIGVCFVAAGVIFASLFGYDYFSTYGFLNEYHIHAFAGAKLDLPMLVANIVWKRGKLFLLLWIVSYTPARRLAPVILQCAFLLTAGMFIGACIISMGAFGIIVFLCSWIPHGLFYLFALVVMFRGNAPGSYGGEGGTVRRIVYVLCIFSLLLFGCVTEATAGTWILQRVLSLKSSRAIR